MGIHRGARSQVLLSLGGCNVARLFYVLIFFACLNAGIATRAVGTDDVGAPRNVLAIMERVADWQIAHPARYRTTDWTQGALYAGVMALDSISSSPRFREVMRGI